MSEFAALQHTFPARACTLAVALLNQLVFWHFPLCRNRLGQPVGCHRVWLPHANYPGLAMSRWG